MQTSTAEQVRRIVREAYGAIAAGQQEANCAGSAGTGCCGTGGSSRRLGYTESELAATPAGADLGLGCGNPHAIASLRDGQRVLDLGSGAGFDAFLAARQVGPEGHVIGVDMTPAMIALAHANAEKAGLENVEFRLGDVERLPVDDGSVDVIMSNCVINLVPDKVAVFREAHRVLVPGGRLAIADMVAVAPLPADIANDPAAYTGCIAGAAAVADLERMIAEAGFHDVRVTIQANSAVPDAGCCHGTGAEQAVVPALIEAARPA